MKNNQKAKQKFRASKKWKDFREKKRKEQITDPVTRSQIDQTGKSASLLS